MGCGIKAYYEELDEKIAQDKRDAFKKHSIHKVMEALEYAINSLNHIRCDPNLQLSRTNWSRLDNSVNELQALLK